MISISIIEDDVVINKSIETFLNAQPEFFNILSFGSVEDFLENITNAPDVILLDIELPGMTGIEGCFYIKKKFSDTDILILTVFEDKEKVFSALQSGACGYLLKNTSLKDIKESIIDVKNGGAPMSPSIAKKVVNYFATIPVKVVNEKLDNLTKRELEVANLLIEGNTYKQVAYYLKISTDTVRQHIKNIYSKLQINSRIYLVQEFNKR